MEKLQSTELRKKGRIKYSVEHGGLDRDHQKTKDELKHNLISETVIIKGLEKDK